MAKKTNIPTTTKADDFIIYKDVNGNVKIEIYIFDETIWLTQDKIAQLFGVQCSAPSSNKTS